MYKYLMKRLEEANLDPRVENLVFIPAEALRGEYASDAFNEFMENDTETILQALEFNNTESTQEMIDVYIEEKTLSSFLVRNQRAGFLARVLFSKPSRLYFDKQGEVAGWDLRGVSSVHWIYADSIGELVEKIIDTDKQIFDNAIKNAKQEEKDK